MGLQVTYHNTGLTPHEAAEKAWKSGEFRVRWRRDCVHVMLYPKQFPNVKVQVCRGSANVWYRRGQLSEVEELLNSVISDSRNRRPFKAPTIQPGPGEMRKILQTDLGLIGTFVFYHPVEIATALKQIIEDTNTWNQL